MPTSTGYSLHAEDLPNEKPDLKTDISILALDLFRAITSTTISQQ